MSTETTTTEPPKPKKRRGPSPHTKLKNKMRDWLRKDNPNVFILSMPAMHQGFRGLKTGIPDIYVAGNDKGNIETFWLEVKYGKDRLRESQVQTINEMRGARVTVIVAYSLEELQTALGLNPTEENKPKTRKRTQSENGSDTTTAKRKTTVRTGNTDAA